MERGSKSVARLALAGMATETLVAMASESPPSSLFRRRDEGTGEGWVIAIAGRW